MRHNTLLCSPLWLAGRGGAGSHPSDPGGRRRLQDQAANNYKAYHMRLCIALYGMRTVRNLAARALNGTTALQ